MNKKPGRPKKSWVKEMRLSIWYLEVRRACFYGEDADRLLDEEFAWRNARGRLDNSARQSQTFWRIGRGMPPPARHPDLRSMGQLLDAMELDPRFKGLKAIYDAPFWELILKNAIKPKDAIDKLDAILKAHNLKRVTLQELAGPLIAAQVISDKRSFLRIYNKCIHTSKEGMDIFTKLSMYWLLYLQNEFSRNNEIRNNLISMLDESVEHLFSNDYYVSPSLLHYENVINAIRSSKLDLSDGDAYLSTLEIEGAWLIVPKDLIGNVGKDFFSSFQIAPYSPWGR